MLQNNMPDTLSPQAMVQAQSGGANPPPIPSLTSPSSSVASDIMSPQDMVKAQTQTGQSMTEQGKNSWSSAGKWLANSASSIEKPLVSIAAIPVQMIAKAAGVPDPYANGFPGMPGSDNKTLDVAPIDTGAGIMQKAGQLAQIASFALTPEAAGMSGIIKMGLVGGLGAGANYTAGGGKDLTINPFDDSEMAHAVRQGVLFGGILGGLGNTARVISSTEKWGTGIDAAMETELARTRPVTVGKYIEVANASAKDNQAQTIGDFLTQDIRNGADILDKKVLPAAGKAVGAAHKAAAGLPIAPEAINSLRDEVNNAMQSKIGHQFSDYATGADSGVKINYPEGASTAGISVGDNTVVPLPGRPGIDPLLPSEQKDLEYLSSKLDILKENPTIQTASDIVSGLDKQINWERVQKYGSKASPVDSILQQVRGMINHNIIRPTAPALAQANDAFGPLMQAKDALVNGAGQDLQHLDLLGRRTVYDGQAGKAKSVLDILTDAVRPYLPTGEESYTTKAIIARFVKDNFGGLTSKSGFRQGITAGDVAGTASGYTSRIVGAALRTAKRALTPNTAQYAISIAKGEPYSFVPGVHHIDEFLDSPSSKVWIQSFKDGLKKMGVSSSVTGGVAKDTLRMMMIQNLSQSAAQNASGQRQLTP